MTTMSMKFNGVVLAGGLSSRMGQDKALLTMNDETLLDRSVSVLKRALATEVFISRNDFEKDTIPDIYPQFGPLSGIHATLFASKLPIVCIPVDMPFIDEHMLKQLVMAGINSNQITIFKDHNLPIFIPHHQEIKTYLEHTLTTDNNKSIKRMMMSLGYKQISISEAKLLSNVNTPEQWRRVRQPNT